MSGVSNIVSNNAYAVYLSSDSRRILPQEGIIGEGVECCIVLISYCVISCTYVTCPGYACSKP